MWNTIIDESRWKVVWSNIYRVHVLDSNSVQTNEFDLYKFTYSLV